jgi:DNA-binding GntR family transcriptional regulator
MTRVSKSELDPRIGTLAPPPKEALADAVVDRLRQSILEGYVAPGEPLREERLAAALDVSRGPVREAILQLEREGLVVRRPHRGAVVARLSRRDLEEVFSLRLALDRLAFHWATRRATDADLARLEASIRVQAKELPGNVGRQRAAQLDLEFHDIVYELARHERLQRFWSILRPQVHIFLLSRDYVGTPDFADIMVSKHTELLEAIRRGDPDLAEQVAEEHVRTSYKRVVSSYDQDDGDDDHPPSLSS